MREAFLDQDGQSLEVEIQNRFITEYNGSTILEGVGVQGDVVIKFSARPCGAEREWLALKSAYLAGIHVPRPIALVGDTNKGLMMDKIAGSLLTDNEDATARSLLGKEVRVLHDNAISPLNGNEWSGLGKADFSFYNRQIEKWKKDRLFGDAPAILSYLGKDVGNTFAYVRPVLVHNDLHDAQVIESDGEQFIIDFEFWKESHPFVDLSKYLQHVLRSGKTKDYFWQLCRGYSHEQGFGSTEKDVLTFLLLFSSCQRLDFFQNSENSSMIQEIEQHDNLINFVESEEIHKTL